MAHPTDPPATTTASPILRIPRDGMLGLDAVVLQLEELLVLPVRFPQLFVGRRSIAHILLYGLHGTGKHMLLRAVAQAFPETEMQTLHFSDVLAMTDDRDGCELIIAAFAAARAQPVPLLVIEDLSQLVHGPTYENSELTRRYKTELLVQLQTYDVYAIVPCARPWQLNRLLVRRMDRRVPVLLPDEDVRLQLIKHLADRVDLQLPADEQLHGVGQLTHGYSGGDLLSVVGAAARAVQERSAGGDQSQVLTVDDLVKAVERVPRSTCDKQLAAFLAWHQEYGPG